jgi:hypothetical protein
MTKNDKVHIEEEVTEEAEAKSSGSSHSEGFQVKGEELIQTIKKLAKEAGVRRIVVKNKNEQVLIEIPLVLGVSGILLFPSWSALALVTALVTESTIHVERMATKEEEPE